MFKVLLLLSQTSFGYSPRAAVELGGAGLCGRGFPEEAGRGAGLAPRLEGEALMTQSAVSAL